MGSWATTEGGITVCTQVWARFGCCFGYFESDESSLKREKRSLRFITFARDQDDSQLRFQKLS